MRKALSYLSARIRRHKKAAKDGETPRFWQTLACDALLLIGAVSILGGPIAIIVGAFLDFDVVVMTAGAGAFVLGCLIAFVWEKLFWEPFARRLRSL